MDEPNPDTTTNTAEIKVTPLFSSLSNTNPQKKICINSLDIDMYVLSEEQAGASCVRFTAIAENYKDPIFYGKIFKDSYKVRWQIDQNLTDIISAIHTFNQELEKLDNAQADEEDDEPFSYELNGLKIVQESYDEDIIIPFAQIPEQFWNNPKQYFASSNITTLTALYLYTPYAEIGLTRKDKHSTAKSELCVISHLERHLALAEFIRKTHCLHFTDNKEPLSAIENALLGFKNTFTTHFQ